MRVVECGKTLRGTGTLLLIPIVEGLRFLFLPTLEELHHRVVRAIFNSAFCRRVRSEARHLDRYPEPFGPFIRPPTNYVAPVQVVHGGAAVEYCAQCDGQLVLVNDRR